MEAQAGRSMTGPRIDPMRAEYDRERAQYESERAQWEHSRRWEQPADAAPEQPKRPGLMKSIADIMAMGAPGGAGLVRMAQNPTARGMIASGINGATLGWGDEAVGLASPQMRDAMRADVASLKEDHPVAQMLSELAGGVATGGVGAAVGKRLLAKGAAAGAGEIASSSMLRKAAQAAAGGGATGALYGAGAAKEGERTQGAIVGGAVGTVAGAALSPVADLLGKLASGAKGAVRTMRGTPAPNAAANAASDAIDPGARRVLARAKANGMQTVDELGDAITNAPERDLVMDVMGERAVRDVRTARMMGKTTPDAVESSLRPHAQGELPALRTVFDDAAGPQVDDVAFANERLATARANARPEYERFEAYGALRDKGVKEALRQLNSTTENLGIGKDVVQRVSAYAAEMGERMPKAFFDANGKIVKYPSARQLDWIKKALDEVVGAGQAAEKGQQVAQQSVTFTGSLLRRVEAARDGLVDAADAATKGQYKKALGEFAGPMQERTAFMNAQRDAGKIRGAEGEVERLLSGSQREATKRGTANAIHEELGRVSDGTVGNIQNPAPILKGNAQKDARLRVAVGDDAAKVEAVQTAAEQGAKRLRNFQTVTGGSQTADKLSDAADAAFDPAMLDRLVRGDVLGVAGKFVGGKIAGAGKAMLGDELDAMARYLMAGAPGQMTKAEAVAQLRIMAPRIKEEIRNQVLRRAGAAGFAGGQAGGSR